MAKLVDVYNTDKDPVIKRRQLPLVINENLTMIMDLNAMGLVCDNAQVKGRDYDEFMRKYKILTADEIKAALKVTCPEILNVLSQSIPCVGCRRSVERLFFQLMKSGHPTLDPLIVTPEGILTIREDKINHPQPLSTLLHGHSAGLECLESQSRWKKSRRCVLHSLEGGRAVRGAWGGAGGGWRQAWDCMRSHCREEVTLVEFQTLQDTLDNYLRKHRFCAECKTKVLRAYQLLVEEKEPQKEKGYVGALYGGIKRCLLDKHLHLQAKTDYITNLIMRAEPELLGNHRERHAKTLEIAQEEVLICLGICVYERLHRISLRLREEEGTCQVLVAVAIEALYRKFETAVEQKSGVSKLELLFEEITQEEAAKQLRKEQKKLRRRKKKERLAVESKCDVDEPEEKCQCEECLLDIKTNLEMDNNNRHYPDYNEDIEEGPCHSCQSKTIDNQINYAHLSPHKGSSVERKVEHKGCSWSSSDHSQDCGYSSENNNGCCETGSGSSSLVSSPEGSEVACSEGFCNHEGGDCSADLGSNRPKEKCIAQCSGLQLSLQEMLLMDLMPHNPQRYINLDLILIITSVETTPQDKRNEPKHDMPTIQSQVVPMPTFGVHHQISLMDTSSSDDEQNDISYIPIEDLMEFKSRRNITEKRQELRQTLRKNFAKLCVNAPQRCTATQGSNCTKTLQ